MARLPVAAACAGAVAGVVAAGAYVGRGVVLRGGWGAPVVALAAVLVLDSLVAFIGPRRVLYSTALLSAALAAVELGGANGGSAPLLLVTALCVVTAALSVLAATREGRMPEESNPMNLPVFG